MPDTSKAATLYAPSRRVVLGLALALAAPALIGRHALADGLVDPFTLGVASGDPAPDGFVIWTRLAPQPLAEDGGGGLSADAPVTFEVAEDPGFRTVVRRGRARASAALGHSVHVEVAGLKPGRPYWYRFAAMGAQSAVGTARTAPAAGAAVDHLRFAFASCSHWELGWFSAYRHMAAENPDLVLFLGDYIYEYSYKSERDAARLVRRHDRREEIIDLAGYRNRYALYRTDPDLQALHACAPCLVTWDDHEVQNDYANRWSQDVATPEAAFLKRRRAAYQAFYEHMPVRRWSRPTPEETRVYGRFGYGALADFTVLDGRQYRSIQPCARPDSRKGWVAPASCTDRVEPARTMLGARQEAWLYDGFGRAKAQWNIIAQDLLVADIKQRDRDGALGHWTDGWDGYPANRKRMLDALAQSKARNPVFLGGDIHSFWTTDLKADFNNPGSATIATEFVGAAVTQDGPPANAFTSVMQDNPHVKFYNGVTNGYVSVDLTPRRMDTRLVAISDRRDKAATASTLKAYVVEDGRPGAVEA
ncbi:MAG: Phosphodiesterase/alkaline phosphatase [Caulobacter sp.]|nr:Phosphodiesterase/alkaline phosphatase [Caulobacter sp.]